MVYSRGDETPSWVPFERVRPELERRGFHSQQEIAAGSGKAFLAIRDGVS
jgi:murein DD-endopeptidase MepM/ murein hydrolase activator NlpD